MGLSDEIEAKNELVQLKKDITAKATKVRRYISQLEADIRTLNATDSVYLKKYIVGSSRVDQIYGDSMFGVTSNSMNEILSYFNEWIAREPGVIADLDELIAQEEAIIEGLRARRSLRLELLPLKIIR